MMYNVPEQETNDIEERNTQEFQCVDDFKTKGIKIGSLNIKHVNRMGRYVKERKDKPRPMCVTFTEKNSLLRIFRNISNLKKAEEKYHRISIQRELLREEMEAFHSKRKKEGTHRQINLFYCTWTTIKVENQIYSSEARWLRKCLTTSEQKKWK